jgi:hypothetical protein
MANPGWEAPPLGREVRNLDEGVAKLDGEVPNLRQSATARAFVCLRQPSYFLFAWPKRK